MGQNNSFNLKFRLIIMNFLEFAIWGAYLTSMGSFLAKAGFGEHIWLFYASQGFVSIFMPALMGIIADKWIPAQKVLSLCHGLGGIFMLGAGIYAMTSGDAISFGTFYALYTLSIAFFMPTLAISNSVAFNALEKSGLDTIKDFPPIRVFGTVGFICTMLFVNFMTNGDGVQYQHSFEQFIVSGILSITLCIYSLTLPKCPCKPKEEAKSFMEASGLNAFTLFKERKFAIFFIFSMLLGASLQITNGYANTFITSFKDIADYADTWGANNANALISISQISETLCILLIPFFLKRYGIKKVMLISMFAWVLRFAFFGLGNPGDLVWLFVLSCIVYGVAFDFFNISGALFVNDNTSKDIRSSAQGLFILMTNGLGASIGTWAAGLVVNHFVYSQQDTTAQIDGWTASWAIFSAYAFIVAVLFAILFKYKHERK